MYGMLKRILTSQVYEAASETPLEPAPGLSLRLDNQVLLKREDLQPVFSFKLRGAYNRIAQLSRATRERGIIAASAGNHAQGVAFSARKLGIEALIVMPATTPAIKVAAVRSYGAEVILHGDNYSEAAEHCAQLQQQRGMTYIHPFDDDDVIAGQGTIADELLRQSAGRLNAIFVPVGGGGLIAGIAAYIKALRPDVKVIGVEPEDSCAMTRSLRAGQRVELETVGIFADGVAVRQVGSRTFDLCRRYVDDMVLVSTDEICSGIKTIYQETRSIVEPAGALGVAGLQKYVQQTGIRQQRLVAINSGANMNFDRLRFVAERTQIGEKQEALFAVSMPEQPGALRQFCTGLVGERNITEFNYRMACGDSACIFVGISIRDEQERFEFFAQMRQQGYDCEDLTDNDLAKTHVRYMVGGRCAQVTNEHLYRFWFPERPGALARFLAALGADWNISLFHYRAQGGDYGRVLVGLELPPGAAGRVRAVLDALGYYYIEEQDNPAYRLFL
ncbi:threonine ammonia-lyase, biosynthetic [Desulfuromonas thiophila]|jgi:threonine dehydratase|uniref:threonine ammonia-lyase, biosynthetic n=1 Tax=Desulfuromonas thiophila TaxID=57664 RepID=UPI0024A85E3E|nr:threonine ammonia-lyase, biosynthetic [Desulfuromonas thiophila]MCK9172494.1 threonine ammonia-lyase, biosynthetic [Desulfuromonas thiophila]